MAKASFSAYVLVKILLTTGEKVHLSTKKSTTNFGFPFCFFPFPFFLKMTKMCCFCLAKSQKRRQRTRPPPKKYIKTSCIKTFRDPLGCFGMCWLSWFSGPGCCCCPSFHLRLGASGCSPGLAFCCTGPWTLLGSAARSSPTVQNRDAQHMFLQHRGAHADFRDPKTPPLEILYVWDFPICWRAKRPHAERIWGVRASLGGSAWEVSVEILYVYAFCGGLIILWQAPQENNRTFFSPGRKKNKVSCVHPESQSKLLLLFGYPVLRSQPQWIPKLWFGYPSLRNLSISFWEKLGVIFESLGGLSALSTSFLSTSSPGKGHCQWGPCLHITHPRRPIAPLSI